MHLQLGKILFIDRAVNPQTGSIDIRLVFPNPRYMLRPGMSTVVRVYNQDPSPQILKVPARAVVEQMGEYFLFIAKDTVYERPGSDSSARKQSDTVEKSKLRAFQKKVQLGQTIGPNVVIKSGIKVGDQVIVDGVQAIHEGSQITTGSRKRWWRWCRSCEGQEARPDGAAVCRVDTAKHN